MTKLIDHFDGLDKILDEKVRREVFNAYNEWVIFQPSIIDGDYAVAQPHHVQTCNNHGMGMKPNDLWQIPITYKQHTDHHSGKISYQDVFLEKLPELHERFLLEMG